MFQNAPDLIVPVFTPFKYDEGNSVNFEIIPKYVKYLHAKGVKGILVNGTSGEGTALTLSERKEVSVKWLEAVKNIQYNAGNRMHVMVQVGGTDFPSVLELARHAESIGVDSLLCLPELYVKPTTNEQLINYLKCVGNSAPNTPLLFYHIPMFTGVTLHMGSFLTDISNRVPTFSGIKFTSNALDEGIDAKNACGGKFKIYLGADKLILPALALGMDSVIATTLNICPQLCYDIKDSFEKNISDSKLFQQKLHKIVDIITKHGQWVSTMKVAMNTCTEIDCGPVRIPLTALTVEQVSDIESKLKSIL